MGKNDWRFKGIQDKINVCHIKGGTAVYGKQFV